MRGLGWGPRVPADPRVALTGSGSARGRPRVPGAMGRRASDPVWWGDGGGATPGRGPPQPFEGTRRPLPVWKVGAQLAASAGSTFHKRSVRPRQI